MLVEIKETLIDRTFTVEIKKTQGVYTVPSSPIKWSDFPEIHSEKDLRVGLLSLWLIYR